VVGIPHDQWGEAIHGEVMLKPGASASAAELIEHAKTQLGRHKTPKSLTFVTDLPLSAAHKVLRRKVREKYWAGQQRLVG
jgi:fatty-acyl-CoA synthase